MIRAHDPSARAAAVLLALLRLAFVLGPGAALAVGCADSGRAADDARLTVFAAASTSDVIQGLSETFEPGAVRTSYGASSALARQIEDGAPADVFVSASRVWIERLRDGGHLSGEPRVFARNRLVCVAPRRSPLLESRPSSVAELRRRLAPGDRVAIADDGVPAGEYARQSLRKTGDLDGLKSHLVGQRDVRAVLWAVSEGHAAAGFVYATDARAGRVAELFALDASTHHPVEYFIAVTAAGARAATAGAFLEHALGPAARRGLTDAGFEVPAE